MILLLNKWKSLFIFLILAQTMFAHDFGNANWITVNNDQNQSNTWMNFIKTVEISDVPVKAMAKIACDSKYWMWINSELIVFEGQLKRGPTPDDTYYDELDIASHLQQGKNTIAILVWYFGKHGFSHKSSGKAGLIFRCDELNLNSDGSWLSRVDEAFESTNTPYPNFRLPESNIRFNAMSGSFDWVIPDNDRKGFSRSTVLGKAGAAPWNKLVKRSIPLWKNYGLKDYVETPEFPFISTGDTVICKLPYNAQITPYFKIESESGEEVHIRTDNYLGGSAVNVRAEYVTRKGVQEYESLGWLNGHDVRYYFPKGVKVLELKYRETGYDTEFTGSFACDDPFFNRLWEKAVRTLYVNMRDTWMDCPDRERSQWSGDAVNESSQAFYALSPSSSLLTQKAILEVMNWQRKDGTIFSPIPAGNWNIELPQHQLLAIGDFGFWNYYMNTGDKETIEKVYDRVKRYIDLWKLDKNGLLIPRKGDWYWGDWGPNVDKDGVYITWYYLALKGYRNMSGLLGKNDQVKEMDEKMIIIKEAFNTYLWNGAEYRSPDYTDGTDDRLQALAVVSGLASAEKYPAIYKVLQTQKNASPYMEKFVAEALFQMGYGEYGLERLKERFSKMVNDTVNTTLYEGWGIGHEGYGGGSYNHAFSGGGLTILSQYVCGLSPITPAWKSFRVKPMLSGLKYAKTGNETASGKVYVEIKQSDSSYELEVKAPDGCNAVVHIPTVYNVVRVNGKNVYNKKPIKNKLADFIGEEDNHYCFNVQSGVYHFVAK